MAKCSSPTIPRSSFNAAMRSSSSCRSTATRSSLTRPNSALKQSSVYHAANPSRLTGAHTLEAYRCPYAETTPIFDRLLRTGVALSQPYLAGDTRRRKEERCSATTVHALRYRERRCFFICWVKISQFCIARSKESCFLTEQLKRIRFILRRHLMKGVRI